MWYDNPFYYSLLQDLQRYFRHLLSLFVDINQLQKLHTYTKSVAKYICWMCILVVNVALNKPAYQQFPYRPDDDIYDASNAVDGRKSDLSWDGGQCALSEYNKSTVTFWVNLTSIHSIHHITIYFLTSSSTLGTITLYFADYCHCIIKCAFFCLPFYLLSKVTFQSVCVRDNTIGQVWFPVHDSFFVIT